LLKSNEGGSAPLETIFAMALLGLLVLGTIQVSLVLYAKNVLASSAHEGARSAVELGRDLADADRIATNVVSRSAGGLVNDLEVATMVERSGVSETVIVRVTGSVAPLGPIPVSIPFSTTARASRAGGLE
jgi:Flp pilus assembly protein TadG